MAAQQMTTASAFTPKLDVDTSACWVTSAAERRKRYQEACMTYLQFHAATLPAPVLAGTFTSSFSCVFQVCGPLVAISERINLIGVDATFHCCSPVLARLLGYERPDQLVSCSFRLSLLVLTLCRRVTPITL